MNARTIAMLGLALATPVASGQTVPPVGIVIEVDDPELRPAESTTVTLSAAWLGASTRTYDIARVDTNLLASTGGLGLSDPMLLAPMNGPGTLVGEISATGVDGILAGKLNWPFPIFPPPPYPLPFWQVTYTAPADVAAPFEVELSTLTTRFDAYIEMTSHETVALIDEVVEGEATIRVIPGPGSGVLLVAGACWTARRRR